MSTVRASRIGVAMLVIVLTTAACSKEDRAEIIAAIGSQVVVEGANDAFDDAGIQVDGDMDCFGDAQDDVVSVHCTGTSTDGEALELQGDLAVAGEEIVESPTFTGTAPRQGSLLG